MSDEKEPVQVPEKFQAIVKQIEEMSVLDLSELVHVLEDKFGVSAAAPAMMMASAPAAGEESAAEEKSAFTVELTEVGAETKLPVIKMVRELTQLGLKDAKDLVDKAPSVIKENVPKEEAEEMKAKLEKAGSKVVLK